MSDEKIIMEAFVESGRVSKRHKGLDSIMIIKP